MLRNYEDKMLRGYEDKFILIASGPSLTKEDVDYCKGKGTVIAINDNYKLAPWADILYACDLKWWQWHDGVLGFKGRKITQNSQGFCKKDEAEQKFKEYKLEVLQSENEPGLSNTPGLLHTGSNSGYQAINLAYLLGAKKIILLGYDMQLTDGKAHWFGDHPDKVISNHRNWHGHYAVLAEDAKKQGVEIINCTRQTALRCFPRKQLEDVL